MAVIQARTNQNREHEMNENFENVFDVKNNMQQIWNKISGPSVDMTE